MESTRRNSNRIKVVWAAAKKIDGARKPNSKEFWARGRDSFDCIYGKQGQGQMASRPFDLVPPACARCECFLVLITGSPFQDRFHFAKGIRGP